MSNTNERDFRDSVSWAWEGIARDCGSVDGEGAVDHLEQVFFQLIDDPTLDDETQEKVRNFDDVLVDWARSELKKYG